MKYIKCDRCGTLFAGPHYDYDRKFLIYISSTKTARRYHEVDLCRKCEDKLFKWVVSCDEEEK